MKTKAFLFFLLTTTLAFSQYGYRDGNRIGLSAGVSQNTLFTSNFDVKPEYGFAGGLSVRGNYFDNWSMIYGMQFFNNSFSVATLTPSFLNKDTKYTISGVQIKLLLSYNIVKDHLSVDFGPVLQVNGKLSLDAMDENNIIKGTALKANQIVDVSTLSGNAYIGVSGGGKVVRLLVFYQYGFTNIMSNLNSKDGLNALNNNKSFSGNLGTINGQIIFNF